MIMSSVGVRDARKQIVTSGLILHLDNSVSSYPRTGTDWNDISGNSRRFYSRHSYSAAGKTPIFTQDPQGYYGFEFNGFSAEYPGMPEQFRAGTYYFQEATTAISFDTSWTIEVLCKANGCGRVESGCGLKFSTLWQKMGSGANDSTQYAYAGNTQNFIPTEPITFQSVLPDTIDFIRHQAAYVGRCSGPGSGYNSYYTTSPNIYIRRFQPIYLTYVFNKQSSVLYNALTYLNGTVFHTGSNQTYQEAPLGEFLIGGRDNNCGPTETWRGWIYDVRMYNRVLTAAEIKQNFNAIRGKAGL